MSFFEQSIYVALFFGALTVGMPSYIYGGILVGQGAVSFASVWMIVVAGLLIADTAWFIVGSLVSRERIAKERVKHFDSRFYNRLNEFFERYGTITVFVSRFIYGTRTVTMLIAGFTRRTYWRTILASAVGYTLFAGAVIVTSARFGDEAYVFFSSFGGVNYVFSFLFAFFVLKFLFGNVAVKKRVRILRNKVKRKDNSMH